MDQKKEGGKGTFNRLIYMKSPYLLQHAENPVDWYPWGDEAFRKAKKEDRPIFLSIGYSTCHWCHVMAHESFEDAEVAKLLNQHYVSVKVDREERPDIDQIYMTVCNTLTGGGGWPLSIFMTPEGKPFFAGTYFPKTRRMGMPGFIEILEQIAILWSKDRKRINDSSAMITNAIQVSSQLKTQSLSLDKTTLKLGFEQLASNFDPVWGGFGLAPKFPTAHNLTFLLRWYKRSGDLQALNLVEKTLTGMRKGGIFDQIGFGFHRYSVDERWLVPHFEKMLYDQALLAIAYIEAFQVTGKSYFRQVAEEIFTYVLRDLTSPEGGFYSAEDADIEGKEGRFYVWTPEEIKSILGKELGRLFCQYYDISTAGNFEHGFNVPHLTKTAEDFAEQEGIGLEELKTQVESAREKVFRAREKRIHPLKDDKVLTSWNGLMIAALAKGYQVFGGSAYADAARKAAHFILNTLKTSDGQLYRRFWENDVAYPGYLEDYSFLVWGLIELYEATFEVDYLEEALLNNEKMIARFWDEEKGGFFYTGKGNEVLIAQTKDSYDGATPSGNSVAALNLMRLSRMTGDYELEKKADHVLRAFSFQISEHPTGYTQFLNALDFIIGPAREIVVAGDPQEETTQTMIAWIQKKFIPNKAVLFRPVGLEGEKLAELSSFVTPLIPVNQKPTVYICEDFACKQPIIEVEDLRAVLN